MDLSYIRSFEDALERAAPKKIANDISINIFSTSDSKLANVEVRILSPGAGERDSDTNFYPQISANGTSTLLDPVNGVLPPLQSGDFFHMNMYRHLNVPQYTDESSVERFCAT